MEEKLPEIKTLLDVISTVLGDLSFAACAGEMGMQNWNDVLREMKTEIEEQEKDFKNMVVIFEIEKR